MNYDQLDPEMRREKAREYAQLLFDSNDLSADIPQIIARDFGLPNDEAERIYAEVQAANPRASRRRSAKALLLILPLQVVALTELYGQFYAHSVWSYFFLVLIGAGYFLLSWVSLLYLVALPLLQRWKLYTERSGVAGALVWASLLYAVYAGVLFFSASGRLSINQLKLASGLQLRSISKAVVTSSRYRTEYRHYRFSGVEAQFSVQEEEYGLVQTAPPYYYKRGSPVSVWYFPSDEASFDNYSAVVPALAIAWSGDPGAALKRRNDRLVARQRMQLLCSGLLLLRSLLLFCAGGFSSPARRHPQSA